MKLICGLGNPGREHEHHRHNVGFMVVDALASSLGAPLAQNKFDALLGHSGFAGEKLLLLEPQTYMNLSGQALAQAAGFYKVALADILVIHDELDLPFGRLQLKAGGAGGHNGLRSVIEQLGEDGFARLRFGVGKPGGPNAKERVTGHVLSGFSSEEQALLPELLQRAREMTQSWIRDGLQPAMNRHNRRG